MEDIDLSLKRIKTLAEQEHYADALAVCEEVLEVHPGNRADILRTRAYVFALSGDYQRALQDRRMILDLGKGTLGDYYLAADNALSAGDFIQASTWLKEVLRLGNKQNEKWFESASYFLLSYTQMELGNYEEALSNLESAISRDPKCAMPLREGIWDDGRLRKEILRRRDLGKDQGRVLKKVK
jgi:tetratricopeptide (TPR) repeat protein